MIISFIFEDFDSSRKVYGYIFNKAVAVGGDFVCCASSKRSARNQLLRACWEQFPEPSGRAWCDIRISWIDKRQD